MTRMRTIAAFPVVVLVGAASAHLGDIVYPIYELPTSDLPDLHDGTLEDWEEVRPNTSLDHNSFGDLCCGAGGIDLSDLAWRVFLAWHHRTQRIYMGVERIDDVYIGPPDEGGDGVAQLGIDGDHSGGRFVLWPGLEDSYSEELEQSFPFVPFITAGAILAAGFAGNLVPPLVALMGWLTY